MRSIVKHVVALVSTVVGLGAVFGLLYWMNELGRPPQKDPPTEAVEMVVEPQREQKPRERRQERPKPQRVATPQRHAPAPNLTTSLSGLSFGLPAFENQALLGTEELLGQAAEASKLVMTEDTLDTPPKPRSRVSPDYPAPARQRGIEGYVVLKVKVGPRGDVETVKVIEAEPRGVFEDASVQAVREWTFEPGVYKGQPVTADVSLRIPFRLTRST